MAEPEEPTAPEPEEVEVIVPDGVDPALYGPANEETAAALVAIQKRNAAKIERLSAAMGGTPNLMGDLLMEIVNSLFVSGSQAHAEFLLRVEQRIARTLIKLEGQLGADKKKLMVPASARTGGASGLHLP